MELEPIVMIMVLFHAMLSTALIWTGLRAMSQENLHILNLRHMVKPWWQVGEAQQALLLVLSIVPIAYGLLKFGIIGYLRFGLIRYDEIAVYAPYWYTSILPFVPVLVYATALSAVAKLAYRNGNAVTWGILILSFIVCTLYGRRSIFYLILLSGIVWYFPRGNLFTLKKAKFFILLLCVIVVFSNIYQTYRQDILSASVNLVRSWDDVSSTMFNLQERIGPWFLNYLILDSETMPLFGNFILNAVKNAIPRVFWPGKVVYDEDLILADHYNLPPIDYPNNPFSTVMADFGILSLCVIPLLYLLVFASAAYFLMKFRKFPTLYLILSVMLLQFIVNIEESFYAAIFGLYRYGTVIVILYFSSLFTLKFFKMGVKTALKNNSLEQKLRKI
ncbi:MAG: hypothetical protein C4538_12005 [Nitrospiraceae bacterium]|nr:MAG: hypothetical protein C4538_12005 [Nitrospiraceae bacterium]